MKRLLPLLMMLTALPACTSVVDDPFLKTGAVEGNWASLATSVPAESALAALPGLTATAVRQTGGRTRIEQTILYANATDLPGENMLTVTMGKSIKAGRATAAPTQAQIQAEMRAAFSGVKMQISPVIADNAYGVFGYATGAIGKGGSCVYAWQFARNIASYDGSPLTGSGDAAQIRLRFCSPSIGTGRVVALMQGLRINPPSLRHLGTLGTLGFGAIPSTVVPIGLAEAQPFTEKNARPTHSEIATVSPVRRAAKPASIAQEPAEKAEPVIANAAKVPLPGETAASAAVTASPVVATEKVTTVRAKPSFVPLPAAVASVAQ